ncbi:MAG: site-specific DNA-methyltransferase, partial [Deltaproteobacteria bacterium]|nr:site-specific DNA-methyltransferase [Deltaproteobacteria bacterium]
RYVRYLDEMPGIPVSDVWDDIASLHGSDLEKFGYPSQKPEALLERIIRISRDEGHLILDPFCGSGTLLNVAERLNRKWIGIDLSQQALSLCKYRLRDTYGDRVKYEIVGEPASLDEARALAARDPAQFAWWAVGLAGARPLELKEKMRGNAYGQIFFHDDPKGETKQVILSVIANPAGIEDIRKLVELADRNKAEIAALAALQKPSEPILSEAAKAGFYDSPWGKFPRLQILTVVDLLEGKRIEYPHARYIGLPPKKSTRIKEKEKEQLELL